jgi:hypothetical protein
VRKNSKKKETVICIVEKRKFDAIVVIAQSLLAMSCIAKVMYQICCYQTLVFLLGEKSMI